MRILWIPIAACLFAACTTVPPATSPSPKAKPTPVAAREPAVMMPARKRAVLPDRFEVGIPSPRGPKVRVALPPLPKRGAEIGPEPLQRSARKVVAALVAGPDSDVTDDEIADKLDGHPWMRWLADEQAGGATPQAIARATARILGLAYWSPRQDAELIQLIEPLLVAGNESAPLIIHGLCRLHVRHEFCEDFSRWVVGFALASTEFPAEVMGTVLATCPLPEEFSPEWTRRVLAAIGSGGWQDWHAETLLRRLIASPSPAPLTLCEALLRVAPADDSLLGLDMALRSTTAFPRHASIVQAALEYGTPAVVRMMLIFAAPEPTLAQAMPELVQRHARSPRPDVRGAAAKALARAGLEVPAPPAPWVMPDATAALLASLAPFDTAGLKPVEEMEPKQYHAALRGWQRPDKSVITDSLLEFAPEQRQWAEVSIANHAATAWQDLGEMLTEQGLVWLRVGRRQGMIDRTTSNAVLWLTWLAAEEPAPRPVASDLYMKLSCLVADEAELFEFVQHEMHWLQLQAACEAFEAGNDNRALAWLDETLRYRHSIADPSGQSGKFELADNLRQEILGRIDNPLSDADTPQAAVDRLRDLDLELWMFSSGPVFRVSDRGRALAEDVLSFGLDAVWPLVELLDSPRWIRSFAWHRNYPRNLWPRTVGECAQWVLGHLCSWHFGVKLDWEHFQPEYRPQLRQWLSEALAAVNSQG